MQTWAAPTWNATVIKGDVAAAVADLKRSDKNLLKYGTGTLDATLVEHGLIDELAVMVRPLSAAQALATAMADQFEQIQREAAAG